ncbi:MAG: DNA-protecting protein DprA [Treponemataceae bacterium]|nr:DNA-protecting protein DprA [Treponemataceae bacterium]
MDCNRMDMTLCVSLARITFLTLSEKLLLLKNLDSADRLALLSMEELSSICGRKIRARSWNGGENMRCAVREAGILEAKRIRSVLYADAAYPALLREIPNAPFMLFYLGDISVLAGRTVSVVGTRRATPGGARAAYGFSGAAVRSGCSVISGLAHGIDKSAHCGAVDAVLEAGADCPKSFGRTAAVLPAGCDTITPSAHKRLAEQIIQTGGCIVSEYVPGVQGQPWRFVQRNRIIAALSPATVVVEAPPGSGALITAQYAVEYNRDVLFHAAAFSDMAQAVSAAVRQRLEADFAAGRVSRMKAESCPEAYVECGAPVIQDYDDCCRCLKEAPGERNCKLNGGGQLDLPAL